MNERVTVELDPEVLAAARKAGVDLSRELTRALIRYLPNITEAEREAMARRWYEKNKDAVDAVRDMIEEDGYVFSDGARAF
ncbi:MAG: type II toxin-antitoxin system CcdA family antitoxin [Pseudorhodoplanes sp.]